MSADARAAQADEARRDVRNEGGIGIGALQGELMRQIRRLGAASGIDAVELEVQRSHAVASLAQAAIDNANTMLRAAKIQDEFTDKTSRLPKTLLQ